jgi:acyl carrier protein
MIAKSNLVKNQTKRLFNILSNKFTSSIQKNNFSTIFQTKINKSFFQYPINRKNFSTDNKISEKESIDLVESKVFETLKRAQKLKHEKLSRTATMEELGFDSLDVVEIVIAFEEEFQIEITGKYLFCFI